MPLALQDLPPTQIIWQRPLFWYLYACLETPDRTFHLQRMIHIGFYPIVSNVFVCCCCRHFVLVVDRSGADCNVISAIDLFF